MVICPKCERPLPKANAWHYCEKVELDSLFEGRDPELIWTFDGILAEVADWEGVSVSATKNCVVFVRNKTFLVVKPMKKALDIKFYSAEPLEDASLHKSTPWNRKYANHLRLKTRKELDGRFFLYFKQSYEMS